LIVETIFQIWWYGILKYSLNLAVGIPKTIPKLGFGMDPANWRSGTLVYLREIKNTPNFIFILYPKI
jgi:hypothetical protein